MSSTQTPTREDAAGTQGLPSLLRRYRWLIAAVVLVVGGVGLALTQPWLLFVDQEVDTAFDVSIGDAEAESGANAATSDDDESAAAQDDGGEDASADAAADDASDDTAADDAAAEDATTGDAAADGDAAAEEPAAATGPVLLASGQFQDRSHPASGQVAFFELEDGSRVLRFEDLATDNGPDLFVYLDTDGPDADAGAYDDGINLGRLQGNVGNQTYEIPADVDLDENTTVIIWCDRFSVAFGTAELA